MRTTRETHPFAGARRMKPTRKHRLAIWECMLGTVYARNAEGEARYFDYHWDEARAFAGVDAEGADPRVWRVDVAYGVQGTIVYPHRGQKALWVRRD